MPATEREGEMTQKTIYVHHKQCFSMQGGECDCIPTETKLATPTADTGMARECPQCGHDAAHGRYGCEHEGGDRWVDVGSGAGPPEDLKPGSSLRTAGILLRKRIYSFVLFDYI